ncbi:MAG: hypothetical protein AAGI66_02745 [Cyanobacteria bacterium P01_H01_bin.74]
MPSAKPNNSSVKKIAHAWVYYHTHWDREWYQPFRAYQIRLAAVVDDILEQLESGQLSCFMLDGQTVLIDDYLQLRPENKDRLTTLIASGKLSVGPWFVMPDAFLVSGESLIRNLQWGIAQASAYGCKTFTGYLPDTFGHSADTATLLAETGIETAIVWRGINPEKNLFYWTSPSGSQVLTLHLTAGYFQMQLQDWTLQDAEKQEQFLALGKQLKRASLFDDIDAKAPHYLLPIGADHMALPRPKAHALLKAVFDSVSASTPDRFMAEVQTALSEELLVQKTVPIIAGELRDNSGSFMLPGVYSSRLYLKQANRQCEHRLVHQLEPLLAMAQLASRSNTHIKPFDYPTQALALAWQQLLLNHPHDSICGCSIDSVHRENEYRFEQVQQIVDALYAKVMAFFQVETGFSTSNSNLPSILVVNTSSRSYTGALPVTCYALVPEDGVGLHQVDLTETVLQDDYRHSIHHIPLAHLTQTKRSGWLWVENCPPLSVFHLSHKDAAAQGHQPASEAVSSKVLSQSALLNASGLSVSIALKENNAIALQAKNSAGQIIQETQLSLIACPEQGDSYNSAPYYAESGQEQEKGTSALCQASVHSILTLAECKARGFSVEGPLKSTIGALWRLNLTLEKAVDFFVFLSLEAGKPWIEITVKHEALALPNHKLQLCFETGAPIQSVSAESHFSTVERPLNPDYDAQALMPAEAFQEIITNTGPIQRFISANGHHLLTEGLTEYEGINSKLGITLHRPFSVLSTNTTGVRGAQAGPPIPTPEGQCLGRPLTVRLAWLPDNAVKTTSDLFHWADLFYGAVWGESRVKAITDRSKSEESSSHLQPTVEDDRTGLNKMMSLNKITGLVKIQTTSGLPEERIAVLACYFLPEKGLVLRLLNPLDTAIDLVLHPQFYCTDIQSINFLHVPKSSQAESRNNTELQGLSASFRLEPHAVSSFLLQQASPEKKAVSR